MASDPWAVVSSESADPWAVVGQDEGDLDSSPTLSDFGNIVTRGLAGVTGAVGQGVEFVGEATGIDTLARSGRKTREDAAERQRILTGFLTPDAQKASKNQVVVERPGSSAPTMELGKGRAWFDTLEFGETPISSALLQSAESLPGMGATMAVGGPMAAGLKKIGGEALKKVAAKEGAVGAAAKVAPTAIGYGAAEGGFAGLQNASQLRGEIEKIPVERLRGVPAFDAEVAATDSSLPIQNRELLARNEMARKAAVEVATRTALSTGLIGVATGGGALGAIHRGISAPVKDGIIKSSIKGAGTEALQEAPQSGAEAYISNLAAQKYIDPSIDPMKGVVGQAVSGGVIGGLTGGVLGAGGAMIPSRTSSPSSEWDVVQESPDISRTGADINEQDTLNSIFGEDEELSGAEVAQPKVDVNQPITPVSPEVTAAQRTQEEVTPAADDSIADILRTNNTPFPTEKSAVLAAKSRGIADVEPVNIGADQWLLRKPVHTMPDGTEMAGESHASSTIDTPADNLNQNIVNQEAITPEQETELETLLRQEPQKNTAIPAVKPTKQVDISADISTGDIANDRNESGRLASDLSSVARQEVASGALPVERRSDAGDAQQGQALPQQETQVNDVLIPEGYDKRLGRARFADNAHSSGEVFRAKAGIIKILDGAEAALGPFSKGMRTGGNKPVSNDVGAAAKELADLLERKPAISERLSTLDIDTQKMVLSLMQRAIHDDKVFQAVIKSVPVDVVNDLVSGQFASKALFDNKSMLPDLSSGDRNKPVSIGINMAGRVAKFMFGGARLGAKQSAVDSLKDIIASEESDPAKVADSGSSSPPGETLAYLGAKQIPATGRLQAGRGGIESSPTSGTIEKHDVTPISDVVTGTEAADTVPVPPIIPREAPAGDRRTDIATRKRIADMSPDDMRHALLTDDLTGLKNRRAYEENAGSFPFQAAVDADSLKWINDNLSPDSGDQMLKAIGRAINDETANGYHISGDEYYVLGQSQTEIDAIMERVQDRLKNAVIRVEKPDGSIVEKRGVEITNGTGKDKSEADYSLKQRKVEREKAGLRAGRGEQPPGISRIPATGKQDTERGSAGEVDLLGQDTSKAQSVADASRAKDEKRSGTKDVPVESGDFFGQNNKLEPALFDQQTAAITKMVAAVEKLADKVDSITKGSAPSPDVSTKQENINTSPQRVQKSEESIQKKDSGADLLTEQAPKHQTKDALKSYLRGRLGKAKANELIESGAVDRAWDGRTDAPLFGRGPIKTPVLSHDAVEAIATGIFKKLSLSRNLKLAVHPTESTLPPEILAAAREQGAQGEINAVYWRNKVHIVSSKMESAADVERAIFHEALGHYGVRALFGKEWVVKANQLYLAVGGEKGVRDFARKAGINMDDYFKSAQGTPDNAEKALYLVDELLAHMQGERATMSLPQRVVGAVKTLIGQARQWLSRNGFVELSKLTDYDLAALLKRMRESATQANDSAGKDKPMFMVLYHGSPHKFDKFDMSKIGTGEGAQAYGHGLYFAESPEVAKTYMDFNGTLPIKYMADGELMKSNSLINSVADDIYHHGLVTARIHAKANGQEFLDAFSNLESKNITASRSAGSNFYKVDIPDEAISRMLDWDKPLSEQHPDVRAGLEKSGLMFQDKPWDTGKKIYAAFGGKGKFKNTAERDSFSSEKLKELGIPGIRYLDGNSRGAGGTSNYVLFDDQLPRILEINGVPTGAVSYADENQASKTLYAMSSGSDAPLFSRSPSAAPASLSSSTQKENHAALNDDHIGRPPDETKAQGSARVIQDKFNRFKVIQDWLKDQGVSLSDKEDVYLAETLMSGRVSSRIQDFRENQMQPLIEKTQKAGFDLEQIAHYLKMQHAPEANKRARELHGNEDEMAFGVSDNEARDALAEYEAMPDYEAFKSLADEWRGITEQTKRVKLDGGLLPQEVVSAWESTYENYIPVKGEDSKTGAGKGLSVNAKEKRRLGHGLRDEAIIENIWRDHEKAISLDEKNIVGQALIRFALKANNPDIITIGKPVKRQVLRGDNVKLQESPLLAENEVEVYVKGHAVRVQINDEIAARAYTNLGVEHLNAILSAGRSFNNWLSKVYTGYSPDFIFTNPIRDAIQGSFTLTGEYGAGIATKIFSNYPSAVKELYKHFRKPGSSSLVTDYRAQGGSTGAAYLSDIERIGADMQAAYNEYSGVINTYSRTHAQAIAEGKSETKAHALASLKSGIVGFQKIPVIGHFLRLMSRINSITENALRVAAYDTLVKEGVSKPRAAAQAKNLMNFNRKGEVSNQVGALYLFYNPSVQGSQVIYRALIDSPHKKQVQALTGMMVIAAYTLAELGRGGDDEDEEEWSKIPDYIKDSNIVVRFGDTQTTLPMPYGYKIFHTLGNVLSDASHGADGTKLGIRMASSVFANFSPAGNPMEGETPPFQLLPTAPKMILGPSVNENSFGNPIGPKRYNEAKPDSQMMNRATQGTAYDSVAETLNEVTGGNDYSEGAVSVSPETLKFWVSSLTGGAGKFAVDAISAPITLSKGGEVPIKDLPVVRKFVRNSGISDTRSAFWDRLNKTKEVSSEFASAKRAADIPAMRDIMKEDGAILRLSQVSDNFQKLVTAKRNQIDVIRGDETLSLKEKQLKIKAIEQAEEKVYDDFIRLFDKATDEK